MNNTIGKHRTKVTNQNGIIKVKYHSTDVVTIDNQSGEVTLNTGGWFTPTTKVRMNQTAMEYGLGFRVYQKDFNWFVERINGDIIEFQGNKITL
tara:strand:- start:110 stop:391 length:282 start_codon:yes stop_codon:yes gene_type:complete